MINIITKSPRDTQGGLVSGGAGTEERGFFAARYVDRLSEDLYFRVYAKGFERDEGGPPGEDDWRFLRTGFHAEWIPRDADRVNVHAGVYAGEVGGLTSPPDIHRPILDLSQ